MVMGDILVVLMASLDLPVLLPLFLLALVLLPLLLVFPGGDSLFHVVIFLPLLPPLWSRLVPLLVELSRTDLAVCLYSLLPAYFTSALSKGLAQALVTDWLGWVALGGEQKDVLGFKNEFEAELCSELFEGDGALGKPVIGMVLDPVRSERLGAEMVVGKNWPGPGDHRAMGSQKHWDLGTIWNRYRLLGVDGLLSLLLLLVLLLLLDLCELLLIVEDSQVVGVSCESDFSLMRPGELPPMRPGEIGKRSLRLKLWVLALKLSLKALRLTSGLMECSGMETRGTFRRSIRTLRMLRWDRWLWLDELPRASSLDLRRAWTFTLTKLMKLELVAVVGHSLT
jgi:hypothetical protein